MGIERIPRYTQPSHHRTVPADRNSIAAATTMALAQRRVTLLLRLTPNRSGMDLRSWNSLRGLESVHACDSIRFVLAN